MNKLPIQKSNRQSGFMVLMTMLLLVVGASVWFGTLANVQSNKMKISKDDQYKTQLKLIKERMLQYAVLHPEIYSNSAVEPGPGYFPCPDEDGDDDAETSCGSPSGSNDQLFVMGVVPEKIVVRNFTFVDSDLSNDLFWMAVDARLVYNSEVYTTIDNNRFPSVNNDRDSSDGTGFDSQVTQFDTTISAPLFLDGQDDIVMVLFYAGDILTGQVRDGITPLDPADYLEQPAINDGFATDFDSTGAGPNVFNDYVIAITRDEWEAAILARVSRDANSDGQPDLCATVNATDNHWFNNCEYTGGAPGSGPDTPSCTLGTNDISAGQGWRAIVC